MHHTRSQSSEQLSQDVLFRLLEWIHIDEEEGFGIVSMESRSNLEKIVVRLSFGELGRQSPIADTVIQTSNDGGYRLLTIEEKRHIQRVLAQ